MRKFLICTCVFAMLGCGDRLYYTADSASQYDSDSEIVSDVGLDTNVEETISVSTETGNQTEDTSVACIPKSCADLSASCGSISDGCGTIMNCGPCSTADYCGSDNRCHQNTCVPRTCESLGACGFSSDGCGNNLNCGSCGSGFICINASCITEASVCAANGKSCGLQIDYADHTGQLINCGTCPTGQTCGGGGIDSKCGTGLVGCTPQVCDGKNHLSCGLYYQGCGGGVLNCGTCPSGQKCYEDRLIGSNTTYCSVSCIPETCAKLGWNCMQSDDGCGGTIDCGVCPAGQQCGNTHAHKCQAITP